MLTNIAEFKDKIKAVFLDIDGTLLNSSLQVSNRTMQAIKSLGKRGIYTVITSGRARYFAVQLSKDVGASHYVISSNGADIYDYKNKKAIYCSNFDKHILNQLMNIAFENKVGFVVNSQDDSYSFDSKKNDGIFITPNTFKDKNEALEFANNNIISQFILKSDKFENMQRAFEQAKLITGLKFANVSRYLRDNLKVKNRVVFCDITLQADSKGSAIKKLLNYLNLEKLQAAAFGDELNDITMFENVGLAVAMGNSIDAVKSEVDFVTDTNDNDGVAQVLELI